MSGESIDSDTFHGLDFHSKTIMKIVWLFDYHVFSILSPDNLHTIFIRKSP